jgi:hypothetical protein
MNRRLHAAVKASMRSPALVWASLAAFGAATGVARAGQEGAIAIRGAAIETVANGRIDSGVIIIRDGKIESVGADLELPDDVRVIDGSGLTILPGAIDPFSRAGLGGGGGGGRGGRGGRRGGRGIQLPGGGGGGQAFSRVADQFYPYQPAYRNLARTGLTHLGLVPQGQGQGATIRLWADRPEEMMYDPMGVFFISVTNSTTSLDVLREGLEGNATPAVIQAGGGERGGGRGGRRGGRGGRGQPPPPTETPQPTPEPTRGPTAELWQSIGAGERVLYIDASSPATIAYVMQILKDHPEAKVALQASGSAVYETIDLIAERKPFLILDPSLDTKPNTRYRINVAREAHERGIPFAFAVGNALGQSPDSPFFAIAYLIKTGLPREAALAALTTRPAELLGLGDRLGAIEAGKSASLLLFRGDPFDPASELTRVMVEGRFVYER